MRSPNGSGVSREAPAPFCEKLRGQFPRLTHLNLHWSLDVGFREDHNQVHVGHAAKNLAVMRRIALNLIKQEKTNKRGVSCRRKVAGWDNKYLLKVLTADHHLKSV